jgi:hypothetical protein
LLHEAETCMDPPHPRGDLSLLHTILGGYVRNYAFSQTAAAKKGPLRGSLKSRPHSIYHALHGRRTEYSLSGSPERQL